MTDTQPKQAETGGRVRGGLQGETRSPGKENLFAAHTTAAPVVTAKSP